MRSMDSSGERIQVLIISRRGELQQPIKQPWHKNYWAIQFVHSKTIKKTISIAVLDSNPAYFTKGKETRFA
jgi:hypothetical protein